MAKAAEVARLAAARSKRDLDGRRVKLTMVRSKTRRHVFHTKLGSRVFTIEDACRKHVAIVSFDEQDVELSLYHEVRDGISEDELWWCAEAFFSQCTPVAAVCLVERLFPLSCSIYV